MIHFISELDTYYRQYQSKIQLPEWTQGEWLMIGTNTINMNIIYINNTQLIIKINDDRSTIHDLKFIRILFHRQRHKSIILIKAKSLEHW